AREALRRGRPRQESLDPRSLVARGPRQLRRRRALPGSFLRRRQRCGRFEGQRVYRRNLRGEACSKVREQGPLSRNATTKTRKHEENILGFLFRGFVASW